MTNSTKEGIREIIRAVMAFYKNTAWLGVGFDEDQATNTIYDRYVKPLKELVEAFKLDHQRLRDEVNKAQKNSAMWAKIAGNPAAEIATLKAKVKEMEQAGLRMYDGKTDECVKLQDEVERLKGER